MTRVKFQLYLYRIDIELIFETEEFFMNWLRRFMYGRYGFDALSNFILIVGIVLYFVFVWLGLNWFLFIPALCLAYTYFRCFSRNIPKRSAENEKFKSFFRPVTSFYKLRKRMWKDRKLYKYYKCPKCRQALRAPRGKGKLRLTCPKCRQEFIVKT